MKSKIRILGTCALIFSLTLPLFVIWIQDYYAFNQKITIDDTQTQEILENHPIISRLYQINTLSYSDDTTESYVIKLKETYTSSQQQLINQLQSYFNEQVQALIDAQVLNNELLEKNDDEAYTVDFGTLNQISGDNDYIYSLDQVYRMSDNNYKEIIYSMEPETHKIYEITLNQSDAIEYEEEDLKDMAWNMICYLELDDIDDWNYNQYGYESNVAKLRVSCTMSRYSDQDSLYINVVLLGVN